MPESLCPFHNPNIITESSSALPTIDRNQLNDEFLYQFDHETRAFCIFLQAFKIASGEDIFSLVDNYKQKCNHKDGSFVRRLLNHDISPNIQLLDMVRMGRFLSRDLIHLISIGPRYSRLRFTDNFHPYWSIDDTWTLKEYRSFYHKLAAVLQFARKSVYAFTLQYYPIWSKIANETTKQSSLPIHKILQQKNILPPIIAKIVEINNLGTPINVNLGSLNQELVHLFANEVLSGLILLKKHTATNPPVSPLGLCLEIDSIHSLDGHLLYHFPDDSGFSQYVAIDSEGRRFAIFSSCPFAKKLASITTIQPVTI